MTRWVSCPFIFSFSTAAAANSVGTVCSWNRHWLSFYFELNSLSSQNHRFLEVSLTPFAPVGFFQILHHICTLAHTPLITACPSHLLISACVVDVIYKPSLLAHFLKFCWYQLACLFAVSWLWSYLGYGSIWLIIFTLRRGYSLPWIHDKLYGKSLTRSTSNLELLDESVAYRGGF